MLVLSRRENERIDFPSLGISVEVIKLTRSRATLGIAAPNEVRVVRHELLEDAMVDDSQFQSRLESDPENLQRQLPSTVLKQIDLATQRLHAAQAELDAGDGESATRMLATTLAELKTLRELLPGPSNPELISDPQPDLPEDWTVAGNIAESPADYTRGVPETCDSSTDDALLIVLRDHADDSRHIPSVSRDHARTITSEFRSAIAPMFVARSCGVN